jgi:hypothetical protein
MCLGDDLPRLHLLCRGRFTASAGEVERSREVDCNCDCHKPGTTLHRLTHGRAAARQS